MKNRLHAIFLLLGLASCQKDLFITNVTVNKDYRSNLANSLTDSISAISYSQLDFDRFKTIRSAKGFYYARIPFRRVPIGKRFYHLRTDSLGHIISGQLIDLMELKITPGTKTQKPTINGRIYKSNLGGQNEIIEQIKNGKIEKKLTTSSLRDSGGEDEPEEPEPIGEQTLPGFILVCTPSDNSSSWMLLEEPQINWDFPEMDYARYYEIEPSTTEVTENYVDVEVQALPPEKADILKLLKCFDNISSYGVNVTFKIKICTDVPINALPGAWINSSFSPGHTFITMTKSNGTETISQSFGFYPGEGGSESTIRNNEQREINASLEMNLSEQQFGTALNTAASFAGTTYNVITNNCTDYALAVINSVRSQTLRTDPLPVWGWDLTSGNILPEPLNNSPQSLYTKLKDMKTAGGPEASKITIDNSSSSHAPESHGECN